MLFSWRIVIHRNTDPTPNDDYTKGYERGSHWACPTGIWVCLAGVTGNAIWRRNDSIENDLEFFMSPLLISTSSILLQTKMQVTTLIKEVGTYEIMGYARIKSDGSNREGGITLSIDGIPQPEVVLSIIRPQGEAIYTDFVSQQFLTKTTHSLKLSYRVVGTVHNLSVYAAKIRIRRIG